MRTGPRGKWRRRLRADTPTPVGTPSEIGELGTRIARLRRARGLSQERLAESASITVSYLSRIEIGRRIPTLEVLVAISRALEVPLGRLFVDTRTTGDDPSSQRGKPSRLARLAAELSSKDQEILLALAERMTSMPPLAIGTRRSVTSEGRGATTARRGKGRAREISRALKKFGE